MVPRKFAKKILLFLRERERERERYQMNSPHRVRCLIKRRRIISSIDVVNIRTKEANYFIG